MFRATNKRIVSAAAEQGNSIDYHVGEFNANADGDREFISAEHHYIDPRQQQPISSVSAGGTTMPDQAGGHHSPTTAAFSDPATLKHDAANSLLQTYLRQWKQYAFPVGLPQDIFTSQCANVQDCQDWNSLQYQCQTHQQMAGLLAAFAFAALVGETETNYERVMSGREVLFEADRKTVEILDQVRIGLVVLAMCCQIRAFLGFVYVDCWLCSSACRKFYLAFCGIVTKECGAFHFGLYFLLYSVPLYVFKFFGFSVVFFLSCPMVIYAVVTSTQVAILCGGIQNIANHAELGLYENLRGPKASWSAATVFDCFFKDPLLPNTMPKEVLAEREKRGRNWKRNAWKTTTTSTG
ncbi:unnamed protein product [Amoebophrya sp. A120]|nr:unnamed protein product [Amoebophrya sp. A120]|eukprot:GSA120T00012386001.1